jgi:hypothetical protein
VIDRRLIRKTPGTRHDAVRDHAAVIFAPLG